MKTVTRSVYYCDYCGLHRLRASAIEGHEPKCIYNPDRSRCGWHDTDENVASPREYAPRLNYGTTIEELRGWAGGCPACMLAIVVQSDLTAVERYDLFDYKAEVKQRRADERHDEQMAEIRDIEGSWL